jgi:lysozyme family protein
MSFTHAQTRAGYAKLWRSMSIPSEKLKSVDAVARRIVAAKPKYASIENATGVPWWFIGILHYRESNLNFTKHLHNGDPLTKRTTRVPAGRPLGKPPFTFDVSAIDALKMKGFHKIRDWTIDRVLFECERYNGFGYMYRKGHNSPYVWGATNHQTRGKFIADGKFDPRHMDTQLGVAPILKRIMELDRSAAPVLFDDKKSVVEATRQSVSLRSLWVGVAALVAGLADGFHYVADGVSSLFGYLPSAVSEGQSAAESAAAVATWLKLETGTLTTAVSLGVMLLVLYRETRRKQVQP